DIDEAAQTGHVPRSLTSRWTTACESPDLWTFTPTVVHGDLAPEHILTDGDRVVGVIEWAAAHVGDPAHDFAPLLAQASDQATKLLIDSYLGIRKVEDPYLLARSVLSSELALLRWLMHGIRIDNDDIVADADSMLVDLAQAAENAEPISEICLTNDTAQVSAPNRSHVAPGSSAIALTPTASATLPVDDHPTMELPIDSDH
ncbi:MAG TPA: phosphotransferase, partial [Beutenbergiaceae bacterium]|nr:phosphotransferase [Beutenbergiaceae bacterium]